MQEREKLKKAAEWIKSSDKTVAFTGAGISVASGIPPFRGPDGLWSKYDPSMFDIDRFKSDPEGTWKMIRDIFYALLENIEPNPAHYALAELGCPVITQNIDGLHQRAGSKEVVEFHGTAETLTCMGCGKKYRFDSALLDKVPPRCEACSGILKPDFVFFKEPIPAEAYSRSVELAESCDLMLVIGTTGEIMPASYIPYIAKRSGARIVEINTQASNFTDEITDLFLKGRAEEILPLLVELVKE